MNKNDVVSLLPGYEECTGCGCCHNVCDNDAIEMIEDEEGFLAPHILEGCTSWNKNVESCILLNGALWAFVESAHSKNILINSTGEISQLRRCLLFRNNGLLSDSS